MSVLVIHLCWDDADPRDLAGLQQVLPPVPLGADGPCLYRRTWLSGDRVLGIEVWSDDDAARCHLDELPLASRAVHLEAPTVVVLVMPDAYRWVLPTALGTPGASAVVPAVRPAAPRCRSSRDHASRPSGHVDGDLQLPRPR
ncbi:hypothetical protein [Geodermatophilus sp. SYSU D00766]